MENKTYIYGLKEENSNIIKYIGKADNPKERLIRHIYEAKRKNKTKKERWFNKCFKDNIRIVYVILEETTKIEWGDREKYWIDRLGLSNLKNHSKGGKGGGVKIYNINYVDTKKWVMRNLSNITSQKKWNNYKPNLPFFIPKRPDLVYKNNGWESWGDFLNTNNIPNNKTSYVTYSECKLYFLENRIKTQKEFNSFVKENRNTIPSNIPKAPEHVYKNNGWESWGSFLNSNYKSHINYQYINFETLKNKMLELKIDTKEKYLKNRKKIISLTNLDIPSHPERIYKENWVSWKDFLNK
jgi:hypothetical protein